MTDFVDLPDAHDAADLGTFLSRARRLDASAVRLHAHEGVLTATVCTRAGRGLMGEGTVLGMRAFGAVGDAACDVVVGIDAVLDRVARLRAEARPGPQRLMVPPVPVVEAWAGLAPPRGGWQLLATVEGSEVEHIAVGGMAEVASSRAVDVRDEVWSRPLGTTTMPAAAALAAHALGFVAPEMRLYHQGRWHRLSGPAGHVLTR